MYFLKTKSIYAKQRCQNNYSDATNKKKKKCIYVVDIKLYILIK